MWRKEGRKEGGSLGWMEDFVSEQGMCRWGKGIYIFIITDDLEIFSPMEDTEGNSGLGEAEGSPKLCPAPLA